MKYEEYVEEFGIGVRHGVQDFWTEKGVAGGRRQGIRLFDALVDGDLYLLEVWQIREQMFSLEGPREMGHKLASSLLLGEDLFFVAWNWYRKFKISARKGSSKVTDSAGRNKTLKFLQDEEIHMIRGKLYTRIGPAFSCGVPPVRREAYLP